MKKYLLKFVFLLSIITQPIYAQNLNEEYKITLWDKNMNGKYEETHLETIGFLPVFKNKQDEITIDNLKLIYKTFINIQILEKLDNKIKILIDFKNDTKEYKKEILINTNQIKDMEDFKIEVKLK